MLKLIVITLVFFGLIVLLYGFGAMIYVMYVKGGQVKLFQLGVYGFILETKEGKQFLRSFGISFFGCALITVGATLSDFL
ncbi:MAG: hypothetical protein AAGJ34_08005 [Pseudomonadota bacterium]